MLANTEFWEAEILPNSNEQSTAAGSYEIGKAQARLDAIFILLAVIVAGVFVGVLLSKIDFPFGTNPDEGFKVSSIINGHNLYWHPILMLQFVRAANVLASFSDPQAVVELGRTCAVIAGGLAVFATFLLARTVLPNAAALATAVAVAVVPLINVHARYLKEDIFALPFVLLALVALIGMLKSPTIARGLLLGTAIGLAAAAKYVAATVLPFALVILLIYSGHDIRRVYLAGLVFLVAIVVFAFVHIPAFFEITQFRSGLQSEVQHSIEGHDVVFPVTLTLGLFHMRESLLPGLGLPLLALGTFGLAAPWFAPPERRQPLFVIASFAVLWYAIHEVSPLKPYPDFARYMLPLAPLLVILGAALIFELAKSFHAGASIAAIAILAAALPAIYFSALIKGAEHDDLRSLVPAILLAEEPRTAFDAYTRFLGSGWPERPCTDARSAPYVCDLDRGEHAPVSHNLMVTSSFNYDRYTPFGTADQQPPETQAAATYYKSLFGLPYLEVSIGRPSYGYFNPVFRIIAVDGSEARLTPIAEALQRDQPRLNLRFVNTERNLENAEHTIR